MTSTAPALSPEQWRRAARDNLAIAELASFVRAAWDIIEPGRPLMWNWHHDIICTELERVTRGECRELVICVPPRFLKSRIVSIAWQAWDWLHTPGLRVIGLGNDENLTKEHSRELRLLLQSRWYRSLVALQDQRGVYDHLDAEDREEYGGWGLAKDQNEKVNFVNSAGGGRRCLGVGSKILGKGADGFIIDDPYDIKDVMRGTVDAVQDRMGQVVTEYDSAWRNRLNNPETGWRVTIMQRLDPNDLAGVLIRKGVRCVVLPLEYDPDFPAAFGGVHPGDPRTEPGELLHPERMSQEVVDDIRSNPRGLRWFEAMYNQRPLPGAGTQFQRHWFRRYKGDPQRTAFDEVVTTTDCAAKKGKGRSYSSIQAWGRNRGVARFFLLDSAHGQWEFVELCKQWRRFHKKWTTATLKLIEDKSNGTALISLYEEEYPGIVGVNPGADKVTRASFTEHAAEAGNIWIPEAEAATLVRPEDPDWAEAWLEEHVAFPGGSLDDRVDATSQLMQRWTTEEASGGLNAGLLFLMEDE